MADSPARALIIYGDGLAPALRPTNHPNLHSLASSGVCGFLALRSLPPQVSETERIAFELAQLLDVHDVHTNDAGVTDCSERARENADVTSTVLSVSERFMGMKAAMVSNSLEAAGLGRRTGFTVMNIQDLDVRNEEVNKDKFLRLKSSHFPNASTVALRLVEMLGLNSTAINDTPTFELVFLHVGEIAQNTRNFDSQPVSSGEELNWIDTLVGQVKSIAQPGTSAASHLYLALVLGYGEAAAGKEDKEVNFQKPSIASPELPPTLAALRPKQTHSLKNGHSVVDVRDHYPLLVVHQMDAVTRRDDAHIFDHEEFQKNGGNLAILADRFLHEIAFKLWRAPKYGS